MGFHTSRLWNKLDYFSIGTIYRRRETFEILNLYEVPPSQSNGSYILGNPFSFQSYSIVKKLNSVHRISGYLHLFFEVSLCVILLFYLTSTLLVVHKQKSKDNILAKQSRFNQMVAEYKVKTQNSSAVKWVALVMIVFLSCYGIIMRCSLLVLTGHPCNYFHYKGTLQAINSGINPLAYACFKRDIKQECKRFLCKRRRLFTTELFMRKKMLMCKRNSSLSFRAWGHPVQDLCCINSYLNWC